MYDIREEEKKKGKAKLVESEDIGSAGEDCGRLRCRPKASGSILTRLEGARTPHPRYDVTCAQNLSYEVPCTNISSFAYLFFVTTVAALFSKCLKRILFLQIDLID